MAKKYDTNPLDPDVLRRAEESRRNLRVVETSLDAPTQFFEAQTRNFAAPAPTAEFSTENSNNADSQTQKFSEPYQSVFNKEQSPIGNSVSAAAQQIILPPTSRKVIGLGIPEKFAMLLPYLPLTLGAVAAIFILLFASRTETRVRFHAAQGLALHLVSWVIGAILLVFKGILPFARPASNVFTIVVTIFFIISLFRVWNGKANHFEMLDDVTDFLNEKIQRQTKG